jgi:hypothetical protein
MKKTLLVVAATLSFGYANAQMKVGSNPTVTTPTANFEVEATNGEKVIVEKATSKVGIGITSPSTKLHIAGALTTQIETVGTFNDILHVTGGGAWGFGDASRVMSWGYNVAGGTGGDGLFLFVPGNFRQSTSLSEATISMFNDNSGSANHKVGIATINPATTLDVNGTTKTTNLQVTTGAGAGKILTSDATGLASWGTPAVSAVTSAKFFGVANTTPVTVGRMEFRYSTTVAGGFLQWRSTTGASLTGLSIFIVESWSPNGYGSVAYSAQTATTTFASIGSGTAADELNTVYVYDTINLVSYRVTINLINGGSLFESLLVETF